MKIMTADERLADPRNKASRINALLRCAICADDTTVNPEALFGDDDKGIWQLLEVAERMSHELEQDIEQMQMQLGLGVWNREGDSQEGA